MSTTLVFWQGNPDLHPQAVYERVNDSIPVEGLAAIDRAAVDAAFTKGLVGWQHDAANIWAYDPDEDGNGPAADVWIGPQAVIVTCYGLEWQQLNEIIRAMHTLDLRLYDPQRGELFQ